MKILDTLKKLSNLNNHRHRQKLISELYDTDITFRRWCKLTYGMEDKTRYVGYKELPKLRRDSAPEDFKLSSLEQIGQKFEKALTFPDIEQKERVKMLTQCFEGVSEKERNFLKNIMEGKVAYMPKEVYQEKLNANLSV